MYVEVVFVVFLYESEKKNRIRMDQNATYLCFKKWSVF